jgi:hypothetical protein
MYPNEDKLILKIGTQLGVENHVLNHGTVRVVRVIEAIDREQEQVTAAMSAMAVSPSPSPSPWVGRRVL